MKYILFFAVIILSTACRHSKTGSGNIITEKRTTEAFMAVHADGPVNVEIRKGSEASVTVEADDNIMPYIETKVSGGTLNIRLRELNNLTNVTIHISVVAASELKDLNASSAAVILAKDTVSAEDHISLKASSAGKVTATVDAPEIMAESSSGGDITARGRTKSVTADASSGASLNASALLSENATADASSGATVQISGSVGINATASSGGSVKYSGGAANVVKNESSGGSVSGN